MSKFHMSKGPVRERTSFYLHCALELPAGGVILDEKVALRLVPAPVYDSASL